MSDKHNAPIGQIWMIAGFGSAMLASKLMLDTAVKVHRAGRPARLLMGTAPFAMASLMLGQLGGGDKTSVLKAPAAERRRSVVASEAEVVAAVAPIETIVESMAEAAETTLESFAKVFAPLAAEADSMLELAPDAAADAAPEEFVGEIMADPLPPEPEVSAEPEPVAEATPEPDADVAAEPVIEAAPVPVSEAAPETEAQPVQTERATVLDAPRDGSADDLTLIKGVGPKLAAQLNTLGYFHFDQIAAWGPDELAWVDSHLQGFAGRATRDDWIGQAKAMLAEAAPEGERLI